MNKKNNANILGNAIKNYRKFIIAVTEQAVNSSSNYLINLTLINSLEPTKYSVFVKLNAMFVLAQALFHALITEPLPIFTQTVFHYSKNSYHRKLIFLGLVVLMPIALILFLDSFISQGLSFEVSGLAVICMMAICVRLLVRQILYLQENQHKAVYLSIIYLTLSLSAISLGNNNTAPSLTLVFTILIVSNLLGVLFFWRNLFLKSENTSTFKEIVGEHKRFAPWTTLNGLGLWVGSAFFQIWYLSSIGAAVDAVKLQGIILLFTPINMLFVAANYVNIPTLAKRFQSSKKMDFKIFSNKVLYIYLTMSILLSSIILVYRSEIIAIIFNYELYTFSFADLLPVAVATVCSAANTILYSTCVSMNAPKYGAFSQLIAAIITIVASVSLISKYALLGATVAIALGQATKAICLLYCRVLLMKKNTVT